MRSGKTLINEFHYLSRIKKISVNHFDTKKFSVDTISKFASVMVLGRVLIDTYVSSHEHLGSLEN